MRLRRGQPLTRALRWKVELSSVKAEALPEEREREREEQRCVHEVRQCRPLGLRLSFSEVSDELICLALLDHIVVAKEKERKQRTSTQRQRQVRREVSAVATTRFF